MTVVSDYASHDALDLAALVRRKEVSPVELVETAVRAIEHLNPEINAVITPLFEEARRAAAAGLPDGAFTGVPFLVKDLLTSLKDVPMMGGSRFLRGFVPDHDSELVARMKRSGLVILGKTNTPELGILPTTEPKLFGPSRNPWDLSRSTGGSSGGSAAAVAAGLVPMAHGNDGGGSIRIPAACCGLFGLKPTRARNSLAPDFGEFPGGLVAEHAVTRSVRDSAALLDATRGPAAGDPYWASEPERPFLEEVGAPPGRLRIAFSTEPATAVSVHTDCVRAVEDAVQLCEALGHEVAEAAPDFDGYSLQEAFLVVLSAAGAYMIERLAEILDRKPGARGFEPLTWALYRRAKRFSATDYLLAQQALHGFSRQMAEFLSEWDVWLTPTIALPPPPLGYFDAPSLLSARVINRVAAFVPFTPVANITGQPAMSVPLFWSDEGLPIGTHFLGRFGDEATLFRLAGQLESARPWKDRRPPVFFGGDLPPVDAGGSGRETPQLSADAP